MSFCDEPELDETTCPRCGEYQVMYQECNECEDGIINDLYEEDPLWYDPGAWEFCRNCNGTGAHRWCRNCGWDLVWNVFLNQSRKPVKEFATRRPFEFILLQSRFVEGKIKTG